MMHAPFIALLLAATPAAEQAPANPSGVKPAVAAAEAAAREERYLRQQVAVDNARQQVEAMRAEIALKDELLVLGRTRNAELYAIASEILARHAKQRSWEPLIQASRVRMDNAVQSYEDRLRAARVTEATLPPSVAARMQAELAPKTPAGAQTPAAATNPK